MPYSIKKVGGKFQVITTDSGKVHGTHGSESQAKAQLRAIYANAPPADEKRPKTKRRATRQWADEYMVRGRGRR